MKSSSEAADDPRVPALIERFRCIDAGMRDLPIYNDKIAIDAIGLPAGKRAFVVSGDEAIGLYKAHSLHSPVQAFTLPDQARAEAQRMLALLMNPPAVTTETAERNGSSVAGVDRRALRFGRRPR